MGLLFLAVAANFNWNMSLKNQPSGSFQLASKSKAKIKDELLQCTKNNCRITSEFGEGDAKQTFQVQITTEEVDLFEEFESITAGGLFGIEHQKTQLLEACTDIMKKKWDDVKTHLFTSNPQTAPNSFDAATWNNIEASSILDFCKTHGDGTETRKIVKIKKEGCDTCEITLFNEKDLGDIEDVAQAIYNALDDEGKKALAEHRKKEREEQQRKNCRIDDNGEDITGMYEAEKRLTCIWNRKVKSEDNDKDKINAYKEHIDRDLEDLVLSKDPQLREQAKKLVKYLKTKVGAFETRQAKDAFRVRLHRFEILSNSLNQTLLTAQACQPSLDGRMHTPQSHPDPRMYQSHQTAQSNSAACIQGWEQKIRQSINQQSLQLAKMYRTINRQVAQTVGSGLQRQIGFKFQELRQYPTSFYDMHQQSLFDNFADLNSPAGDLLAIPSMSSLEAFPMPQQQHYQQQQPMPTTRMPYVDPRARRSQMDPRMIPRRGLVPSRTPMMPRSRGIPISPRRRHYN